MAREVFFNFKLGETEEQTQRRKDAVNAALRNSANCDSGTADRRFRPSDFKKEFWMPDLS